MNSFEFYLLKTDEGPVDPSRLLDTLRKEGWIRHHQADPTRFIYRNDDTGVLFQVLISLGHDEALDAEANEGNEAESIEPDGDSEPAELAPVCLLIPIGCPSFFGREAIRAAERMAKAVGLELSAGGDAGHDRAATPEDLIGAWERENQKGAFLLASEGKLDVWPAEKADAWRRYGEARAALQENLAAEGVHVPRLQAARHEGAVKTLCIWREGTPAVFPETDLVLVERERERKGLIFSRRVAEHGLVSGAWLRDLLGRHAEARESPARLLIFRGPCLPQEVAARLEVLDLEPVENARRTDLLGVVDFDPAGEGEAGKMTQPEGQNQ